MVGDKARLSHSKQNVKYVKYQFSSTAARDQTQDHVSVNQINPTYTWNWELKTQRNRDLQELSKSMMVAAGWLNSWFQCPGLSGSMGKLQCLDFGACSSDVSTKLLRYIILSVVSGCIALNLILQPFQLFSEGKLGNIFLAGHIAVSHKIVGSFPKEEGEIG